MRLEGVFDMIPKWPTDARSEVKLGMGFNKEPIMKQTHMATGFLATLLAASGSTFAGPDAVQLKQIQGSVMVNQGEVYRTATEGMALKVGDRVMVMEGGSMVVIYPDGCVADFKDNQIITIEPVSTCEGGTAQYQAKGPLYADPMGGGGGSGDPDYTPYLFGGSLIGGAVIISNSGNDNTASAE